MALGPGSGYYWPSLEGAMLRLEEWPHCGQFGPPGALLLRDIRLMALDRGRWPELLSTLLYTALYDQKYYCKD